MNDEARVWIAKRKLKNGKASYHLRWICPHARKWKSRKVGTDKRRADREAATLEKDLAAGTYSEVRKTDWQAFVDDHVVRIKGETDAAESKRALTEFGKVCNPRRPTDVTYSMIETFVAHLEGKGNTVATINKKLRYLRAAFNKAVKRDFLARNPMSKWVWARENDPAVRIVTPEEEKALLDKAEGLYGFQWRALLYLALNTGARREELLSLTWDRVDFGEKRIHFANTKGKRDRYVPVTGDVLSTLRRLQAQTLREGGPFVGLGRNFQRLWDRLVAAAGIKPRTDRCSACGGSGGDCPKCKGKGRGTVEKQLTLHDLRRSYVTRLIRAGVTLPTVQKLAGHASIQTTLRYYNWVSDDDLRAGVAKLQKAVAG